MMTMYVICVKYLVGEWKERERETKSVIKGNAGAPDNALIFFSLFKTGQAEERKRQLKMASFVSSIFCFVFLFLIGINF